ncbi:MAG: caspase family protein [Pyrinomonadaceae bacterium]|nr:caspase family protein [Pyrinomonadaceae bacterium]
MSNPYTLNPVKSRFYFNERLGPHGALANRILRNITRVDPLPDSISVLGERRFGKTSLLRYLESEAAATPDLVVASIDMLSLNPQSPAGFYRMLTLSLVEAGELVTDDPPLDYTGFYKFLIKLKKSGKRLILLIDEFDLVARASEFDMPFFENLRSLAMRYPLGFVVASVAPLNKIAHSDVLGSPFFNFFFQERLQPLNQREAEELVKNLPGSRFSDAEATAIISLAGTHTYFLQLCCSLAWDLRETNGGHLDTNQLRLSFAKRASPQHQYVWDHSSDPEKQVLYDLAHGKAPAEQGLKALITRGYVLEGPPPQLAGEGFSDFIKQHGLVDELPAPELSQQDKGTAPQRDRQLAPGPMKVDPNAPEKRLALLVGVNIYQHQEKGDYILNPLSYAEQDVLDMEALLMKSGFSVTKITGKDATYSSIKDAFKALHQATLADPHPESCFVFHFSGHGQIDPGNNETAYLILYDTDPSAPALSGLEMENLVYTLMARVKVPNSLLLLDCCHAGFAANIKQVVNVRDRLQNVTQQIFAGVRGRLVLGACAGNALAREMVKLSHGVFTHHVLKHWRDQDGYNPPDPITELSLARYITVVMPRDYPDLPKPIWGGGGAGSFVLRRLP